MRVSSIKPYNTANYGIAGINQKENRTAETFGALNRENVNFSVTNPFSRDYFLASQNVSFKGYVCSPDEFKIKHAFGIECPCCGNVMLTKKQSNAFAKRIDGKTGFELQREFTKYYENFRQNEKEIVDILIEKSKEHPDSDLSQLVGLEAADRLKYLETAQKNIIDQMQQEAEGLSEDKKEEVLEILESEKSLINNSDDFEYFKRKAFIKRIDDSRQSARKKTDARIMNELLKMSENMPDSGRSKDAFFVKYARRKNEDIARRLVTPSIATTEHIKPQSKNGKNATSNYIPLCAQCNSQRGNMPYNEWFKIHPEMPENLQNYVNTIYEMIQNKEFLGWEFYDTYVDDVIYSVKQETGGKLILKNPAYYDSEPKPDILDETPQSQQPKPKTIEEQREIWLNEYETKLHRIQDLAELRKTLYTDTEFLNIREYTKNQERIKATRQERKTQHRLCMDAASSANTIKRSIKKAKKEQKSQAYIDSLYKQLNAAKSEHSRQKSIYDGMTNKLNELQAKESSLLLLITTPDEMANRIQTAKGEREQTIYELRTVDEQLPGSTASTKDISLLKTKLDGNLRTIRNLEQENLSIESTTDINSPESQEAIEQYAELKTKLQIIRSVDTKTFRKAFDFSDQILPDFILETASKAVKTKLQSLVSKYPAAKHAENKEKISEHQKRADNIAKKIELQKALNAIEQKLSELQERKSQIVKKFNNVNIDEAIERLQKEADEVMTKYSESFENFAYEYNGNTQN
ncbi:TPA: HNH endonuclease [Candidatus Galligastranaerophilus gallistercoris]|nr:HNH endonuclease [Candidatus Galligastranaerophilus gallistercoris]